MNLESWSENVNVSILWLNIRFTLNFEMQDYFKLLDVRYFLSAKPQKAILKVTNLFVIASIIYHLIVTVSKLSQWRKQFISTLCIVKYVDWNFIVD